ncbi:FG-GAP repeat protein [Nonomuraea soli]|uniref:VCBS repeat-containing protein n=1 Tax=Nonomuraea soli TaxID=1032476 RepID=A0A7W0HTZ1_9ACTN|nr:FG-GAP repeat protein [Nonomuraea soli]MBA2895525.1 hypothetical protein [Nonomuraea soli]
MRHLLALLIAGASLTVTGPQAAAVACTTPVETDHTAIGDPFAGPGAVHLLSGNKLVALPSPELAAGDGYGWSAEVADLDGDRCADVLVGAPYADVNGARDAGAVYVLYGGGTRPPRKLIAPSPQQDAHFGWSVSAGDGLIAIGAPYEDEADTQDQGAIYTGTADNLRRLSQEMADVPGNGEAGDQYGWALQFTRGRSLAVGVPYENNDGAGKQVGEGLLDTGSITLINDVTAAKITATKWEPEELEAGSRFGYALAYSDSVGLAVSAPVEGTVRFFDAALKQTSTLRQQSAGALAASPDGRLAIGIASTGSVRIVGPGRSDRTLDVTDSDGRLGAAVAFSGNRLVVGAPDRGPYGAIAVYGRNADEEETFRPGKGAEFGATLS